MKKLNNYITEKLRLNKDIKYNDNYQNDENDANNYVCIYLGNAPMKIIEEFENDYADAQVYVKFNDCYVYILPKDDDAVKKYLFNYKVNIYELVHCYDSKNLLIYKTVDAFVKDCENGKIDINNLADFV